MSAPQHTPDGSTAAWYVPFANGAISISPDKWPHGVWAAYQDGDHFFYDWTTAWNNEDTVNYDKFLVSVADTQGHATSVDVLEDMEKLPSNVLATVFYRKDSHLRKNGTFTDKIIDLQDGRTYFLNLEGCDMPSLNPLSHSTCRQGPLHAVPVEYRVGRPMGDFNWVNFSQLPVPRTVQESKNALDDRTAALVFRDACQMLPWTLYRHEEDYTETALAKLAYADFFNSDRCPGRDLNNRDEVNNSLIHLKPESRTGTSMDSSGLIRTGEYDFALNGLSPIIYKYGKALRPEVANHVIDVLLSKRGKIEAEDLHIYGVVPESENHTNMIESGRYLANQLLFERTHNPEFDNNSNGMTEWWLQRLHSILTTDFIEYNARPYTRQSTTAIQNLYSYTRDPRVKAAAQMVLDYLSAKIAVSSNDARRSVPYRRKKEYNTDRFIDHPDANMIRSLILAGNTEILGDVQDGFDPGLCLDDKGNVNPCKWWPSRQAPPHFTLEMLTAAMSDYRIPDPILDLIVNRDHREFYQGFRHYGEELYASSPSYLLSAGGRYADKAYTVAGFGKDDDIGLAVPTALVPTGAYLDRQNMVRFLGESDDEKRHNMCVAPDFACGTQLQIPPQTYPAAGACAASSGPWLFFNRSGSACRHIRQVVRPCLFATPQSAATRVANTPNPRVRAMQPSAAAAAANQQQAQPAPAPNCSQPGYYLAVYRGNNNDFGLLEAYDTYLHHEITFPQFVNQVQRNNPRPFSPFTQNTYVTVLGRRVQFVIAPQSRVLSVTQAMSPPSQRMFLWGDIMASDGSGMITIKNPFTREQVTFDDRNLWTPVLPRWTTPGPRLGTARPPVGNKAGLAKQAQPQPAAPVRRLETSPAKPPR